MLRLGLVVAIAAAALDQFGKFAVLHYFGEPGCGAHRAEATSFLDLVVTCNRGVSFGLFNGGQGTLLFAALAAVIVAALLWWLSRTREAGLQLAIGAVIGGAIGNIVDRLVRGAVVDFLDFHLGDLHWFAFNVADTAICLGVLFIALDGLLGEGRRNR